MANTEHLAKLKEGLEAWNHWRKENPEVHPDLCHAFLQEADLSEADLSYANLNGADLDRVNLCGAKLNGANLRWVDFYDADLHGADLGGADLSYATLIKTNLEQANLTGCSVYGISAWNVRLEGATQSNLVITPKDESVIQVDNLEVAQFVYLLLNNERIRSVIDTITSKVVLILGRFTSDRKKILDAIRVKLRIHNYLPILFDFQKPESKDLTGTVTTLANMARFIIADVTDPSSSPYELGRIVPNTKVPLQVIILKGQAPFSMLDDLRDFSWVLPPYEYESEDTLLAKFSDVIKPAEAKVHELRERRR
jgi:Pentapeptide repeats (8 copies)